MEELPDIRTHSLCRSCGEWLKPEYGSYKAPPRGTLFNPGRVVRDMVDDATGDTSRHYFVCYDCEHKSKVRRLIVVLVLGALSGLAYLARYLMETYQ